MKKIFAFILATIMVMSLVPASVFAAITNDTGCPTVHTVKNCEYTELGEVAATCTDPSYTAYKCNKCGKQFADNFGSKAAGHKWVDNSNTSDRKNVAVNCATKTDGKNYEKCSVCKETRVRTTKWEDSHKFVEISGIGCEKVFECSICKTQKTDEHTWEFTKVTLEPKWEAGKYVAGEALFTCKDCKDTKTVQILDVACKCKSKSLVKAAVDATCTEDGSYAIYKCDDCHKLYILKDKTYVEIDKIDSKDVVIPNKGGHVVKDGTKKVSGCDITYTCNTCKATVTEKDHQDVEAQHNFASKPTCTTMGYEYLLCRTCGEYWVTPIAATGHKTVTKTVAATCATPGATYTLCCNENCSSVAQTNIVEVKDGKTYNKIVKTEVIPTNDNHKPFVMYNGKPVYDAKELPDATCEMGVVYVWTCENGCATYFEVDQRPAAGHKMELTVESHNCAKATTTLAAWTTRVALKCSACGVTTNTDYVNANSQVMFSSKEEAEVFHGIAFKNTDANGKVTYSYRDGKSADSLGKPVASSVGNCTIPSYDVYSCPTCGNAVYVNTGIQGHVKAKDVAGVAAKCDKTGTVAHSVCALCNAAYVQNADGSQTTLKTTVINKCASTLVEKTTNCSKVTYWQCTKCNKTYTDNTASTAYTVVDDAHAWKDIVAGTIATCNQAGVANVKYCTACKTLEVNRVYKNTRTNAIETIKLAETDAKFEGKKITVTLTNGAELVIEANGTVKDNKANNATLAIAKLEHTTPAGVSTIKLVDESEGKADHTKVGYDQYICEYCAYEYLTSYSPATGGHVNAAGEILTTKCDNASVKDRVCVVCDKTISIAHNYTKAETVPATCVDEGYTIKFCEDCGIRSVTNIIGIDKDNHADPVSVVVNYAQNGYKSGKQPCAACGYKGEAASMKDKGIEVLVSYDVNGEADAYATMGSIITVTLDLGSLNGVNVWGLDFALQYNPEALEYIADATAFNQDSKFNTRLATDVEQEIMDRQTGKMVTVKAGIVRIAASADNAHVAVKGNQNLVTLQFKVISTAYSAAQISVGNVDDFLGFNSYTADFIDETGKAVASFKNGANSVSIELAQIFDMDDNGTLNMNDALAIYTLILFNEYDVAADINADGKIDAEDLRVFYAILTGATTVEEYFKPVEENTGSTPIEPRA